MILAADTALGVVNSRSSWKTGSSGKQSITVPEHARQSGRVVAATHDH